MRLIVFLIILYGCIICECVECVVRVEFRCSRNPRHPDLLHRRAD